MSIESRIADLMVTLTILEIYSKHKCDQVRLINLLIDYFIGELT